MPSNIEVKMTVPSIEAVRINALRHGATQVGVLVQRDTFYRCGSGRLKLREIQNDHAELIAYARSDDESVRTSDYVLAPAADPVSLHEALARALGVRGVVAKRRTLLLWRNVRIHLDEVENLGDYIEFESVVGDVDAVQAESNLNELLGLLDLASAEIVPVAYVDLILARK
jgi:predicted adenylyl cyclase CyaB